METGLTDLSPARRGRTWILARSLTLAGMAALAFETLRFVVRDPIHYLARPTPDSFGPHYWPHRYALLLHIAGGLIALLAGPFQLWSGLRRRALRVHRLAGYGYIAGVVLAGGSAFVLAEYAEPRDFGVALAALATAWWTCLGMAFLAIRRRRIEQHRQWMVRGYVLTLAFTCFRYLIALPIWDSLGAAAPATVVWLAWVLPLLFTEVVLQWRQAVAAHPRVRRTPSALRVPPED